MTINEQDEQRKWRVLRVVRYFLDNDGDIINIENDTDIPLLEAEECLHSSDIVNLLGQNVYNAIQSKLKVNKKVIKKINIARYFLDHGGNIDEVAQVFGMSRSSVQRYLHDDEIMIAFGKDAYDAIQKKLEGNKKEGLSRGGKNYAANNDFTKDASGKFTGSKKK